MQTFLDNYWSEQRKAGRFPRRRSNRLTNVDQWLSEHQILADENHVLVAIGFAFFIVCVINVVGLLLAKFLSRAPVTGIRRALGASRQQIFLQHIVEAGALAAAGATLGLALAEFLLWRVYSWIDLLRFADSSAAPATAMRFDAVSLLWALVLAIGATLGAGLYPAWRAGRVPPAVHLKSQ